MDDLRTLTRQFPRAGRVEAIYLRPGRQQAAVAVPSVVALVGRGLEVGKGSGTPFIRAMRQIEALKRIADEGRAWPRSSAAAGDRGQIPATDRCAIGGWARPLAPQAASTFSSHASTSAISSCETECCIG